MTVTVDEVRWCYLNLLGREPESLSIIKHHASAVDDFPSLVLHFVRSQEFRVKNELLTGGSLDTPPMHTDLPAMVPLDAPPMHIELDATASQMRQLRRRVREAWTHLGETRPHHSVLAEEAFLPENVSQSVERFWARGATECMSIEAILKRHGFSDMSLKTCVEYGSGLGRVTCALAKVFAVVHGYDISKVHLELARQRALEVGAQNITFHLCADEVLAESLEKCDFLYSRIVFQHNPPPLMRELIIASLKSLREGAISIFQVPTYGWGYNFSIDRYLGNDSPVDMEMHCIPQQEVFSLAADEDCRVLEAREDGAVGWLGRWISNTFVIQRPRSSERCESHTYDQQPRKA
jgi:SAM-dependent methyltransferase